MQRAVAGRLRAGGRGHPAEADLPGPEAAIFGGQSPRARPYKSAIKPRFTVGNAGSVEWFGGPGLAVGVKVI